MELIIQSLKRFFSKCERNNPDSTLAKLYIVMNVKEFWNDDKNMKQYINFDDYDIINMNDKNFRNTDCVMTNTKRNIYTIDNILTKDD